MPNLYNYDINARSSHVSTNFQSSVLKTASNSQLYRKEWENLDIFKGWLRAVPNNNSKAYCVFCEKTFRAHRTDLRTHARSDKHRKAEIFSSNKYLANPDKRIGSLSEGHLVLPPSIKLSVDGISTLRNEPRINNTKSFISVDCYTALDDSPDAHSYFDDNLMQIHEVQTLKTPYNVIIANEVETIKHKPNVNDTSEKLQHVSQLPSNINLDMQFLNDDTIAETEEIDCRDVSVGSISTHVVDLFDGKAILVPVMLFSYIDNHWKLISESTTDGLCYNLLPMNMNLTPGIYKLKIFTQQHYISRGQTSLWPHIEISLEVINCNDNYHIPISVGPYGYMVNRG